jgi:hypothetical protein
MPSWRCRPVACAVRHHPPLRNASSNRLACHHDSALGTSLASSWPPCILVSIVFVRFLCENCIAIALLPCLPLSCIPPPSDTLIYPPTNSPNQPTQPKLAQLTQLTQPTHPTHLWNTPINPPLHQSRRPARRGTRMNNDALPPPSSRLPSHRRQRPSPSHSTASPAAVPPRRGCCTRRG